MYVCRYTLSAGTRKECLACVVYVYVWGEGGVCDGMLGKVNIIRHNTIQHNTVQDNTLQCYTVHYKIIHHKKVHYTTLERISIECVIVPLPSCPVPSSPLFPVGLRNSLWGEKTRQRGCDFSRNCCYFRDCKSYSCLSFFSHDYYY